ncbi:MULTISPECIES: acyl carrier protein [Streptomyces]|uniref:Acyl carrier protein n=1 Tax=Streptomyces amritsarensis TaxID=681158 RepID=A0ABX3FXH8_9ACTN|nr:acyl carrier protein [Streptomyces sp. IMTB 1903]AQT71335.1 acyl carrier protein [Streptomyces sp. fd1-xmd]OLZ62083.1 acyl carrier protein [Streptomyces amritsarensis]
MADDDIFDRLTTCTVEVLQVKPESVTQDANLADDLGASSLIQVELVMAVEEEFGISVPDESVEDIRTVGDLHRLILSLVA